MITIENYINGELVAPVEGKYLDNYNPSKGEVYSQIPNSQANDVEKAVKAASEAFPEWSKTPKNERSKILVRLANLIDENLEELAKAEAMDNGKPYSLATRVDIPRASANIRFFATAILHNASESHHMEEGFTNFTLNHPLGVVGCISPWNLPLYLFTWKIAPAIASGCTVVAKPSEVTPMTAYLFSKLCIEAGIPKGVLNIVHGLGAHAGDAIVSHPKVKAISFTGGTATGKIIGRKAADSFKKTSLELGGKNPNIIFADCDFDKMLSTTLHSSFANQGQICLCGSRIFIEKPIYEKFKNALVEKLKTHTVGDPFNKETRMGALVSEDHLNKVLGYVKLAEEEGGTVLFGGNRLTIAGSENGYYMEPTVIEGLDYNCRTNQEEIFGPVVTLTPFETEEEVLEYANSTQYGLAATVWTENLSRAHRVSQELESGIVWVNCWLVRDLRTPFGGVKNSGLGREGGFRALEFFTEPKNVCIKY
ncbi:aldehyde dehydrogenase [bacterium]|jgi:aminomuconate-semialdehyde/2-hydroxymuconate-6-semialdehyde dehydrogenase|nr:aldehyde dehydrogenase [bacterium]MDB9931250.1 aldehyde dehydrogenase [Flavobacteriales bacterium]